MKKMAVHLHIHYIDQLPQILCYLKNLEGADYDLFVTTTASTDSLSALKSAYPMAKIWNVPNLGYDIGPFVDFLHHINLNDYECVLKLHTKGKTSKNYTLLNGNRFDNALWGRVLWDSQLATKERLQTNLKILESNTTVGMVGSKYCLTKSPKDYGKLLKEINQQLQKLNFFPVTKLSFVAGSMYLVRAKCLEPLLYYKINDFVTTDGNVKEGTLAHVVERIIGALVEAQGYTIRAVRHNGYGLHFLIVSIKRFIFQKKITASGKQLIKVCKIPVYSKLK